MSYLPWEREYTECGEIDAALALGGEQMFWR